MTNEDYLAWREHPVTKLFFDLIGSEVDARTEYLLAYPYASEQVNNLCMGEIIGRINSLNSIKNIDYEDIKEEEDED